MNLYKCACLLQTKNYCAWETYYLLKFSNKIILRHTLRSVRNSCANVRVAKSDLGANPICKLDEMESNQNQFCFSAHINKYIFAASAAFCGLLENETLAEAARRSLTHTETNESAPITVKWHFYTLSGRRGRGAVTSWVIPLRPHALHLHVSHPLLSFVTLP